MYVLLCTLRMPRMYKFVNAMETNMEMFIYHAIPFSEMICGYMKLSAKIIMFTRCTLVSIYCTIQTHTRINTMIIVN